MIFVADDDFAEVHGPFDEAFLTHTSTSPNLQIIASLDPTRLTITCGAAGFDGTQFKNLLANRFDIQLNKTSRNSVLIQTNINNTRSDAAHLISVLARLAAEVERRAGSGTADEEAAFASRVRDLIDDVPDLPDFSRFHDAFRADPDGTTPEGQMRDAFFMAYRDEFCEYVKLNSPEIDRRLDKGPELVSANFVIPYPPGFPIMVPGQVISREIVTFMRKLDVKEIHGYHAAAGLKLIKPEALAARQKAAGRADRAARLRVGLPPGVEVSTGVSTKERERSAASVKAKR
jgi:arginine decarboxylase